MIPTELKLVKGTLKPERRNWHEAKPRKGKPTAPAHLTGPARTEWNRLVDELHAIGLLTRIDRAALAAYCQAYGRWVEAELAVARMAERDMLTKGLMIKTTNGNAIQNPLVGIANKAMQDMVRYAVEFGMTPSSRAGIEAGVPGDDEKASDRAKRYF
ncbi:phage terminase small subunit P27 family [Paraburkholderia sp. BR14263]|uniref:phage terminase small subunit P27 family n=1 Tax=unclassified Paraburkholderia TaxID=2615204 RepID=UPI0034CE356B